MLELAVQTDHLGQKYDSRIALEDLSLEVSAGHIFGLLGPNGSGKTTLFRILTTLIPPTSGQAKVLDMDVVAQRDEVRRAIGVVFQSPSLDRQLTATENLRHHGHLYGLRGADLKSRIEESLRSFGLTDRAAELTGRLSGGLRRRVELAKGMLTRPKVLLMDEPGTGLDPLARIELWTQLKRVRDESGVTVLLTTHLMDEADRCDRVAILDRGKLLACDSPNGLKDRIGGDVITMTSSDPVATAQHLRTQLAIDVSQVDGTLRLERPRGHEFVPQIIEAAPGMIDSISVGRPTLEDVFVRLTGKTFREEDQPAPDRREIDPRQLKG